MTYLLHFIVLLEDSSTAFAHPSLTSVFSTPTAYLSVISRRSPGFFSCFAHFPSVARPLTTWLFTACKLLGVLALQSIQAELQAQRPTDVVTGRSAQKQHSQNSSSCHSYLPLGLISQKSRCYPLAISHHSAFLHTSQGARFHVPSTYGVSLHFLLPRLVHLEFLAPS